MRCPPSAPNVILNLSKIIILDAAIMMINYDHKY